jgi:energy-coupling factor transporter ATP-binding protein EcfA2
MTKLDQLQPYEGMGATIQHWSDRTATTIIQITHDGKRLILQADKAIRTDNNGMSEQQDYAYERDSQGQIYIATLRKDGRYRISYTKQLVSLGYRSAYYDFSF